MDLKQGSHLFCDTDSLCVVGTEKGGFVPCPGGRFRSKGKPAIKALSLNEVRSIADNFNMLNPYDSSLVRHILKIEDVNHIGADPRGSSLAHFFPGSLRVLRAPQQFAVNVRDLFQVPFHTVIALNAGTHLRDSMRRHVVPLRCDWSKLTLRYQIGPCRSPRAHQSADFRTSDVDNEGNVLGNIHSRPCTV